MKKIIYNFAIAIVALCGLNACSLDFFPTDELNAEVLMADPSGAKYIIDGCYAVMKDEVDFLGYQSGNSYVRHYFQMSEFPADNTCLSSHTTDPLYEATAYKMTTNLKNLGALWYLTYKVVYMANSVIETSTEGASIEGDQLIGEAYFLRALMHFNAVNLWAKPYSHGRDNMGVVLRNSTNTTETKRATVGEVYDQIVKDLVKASELMTAGSARGNAGYASHDAALGLLSRVYLYMEENQKAVDVVNGMLGGADPASKLETADFSNYYANALTSKETLFALAHTALETKAGSSIGSMYLKDGQGWGEIYPTDNLLYLYERYPDARYTSFILPQYQPSERMLVTFPVKNADGTDDSGRSNLSFEVTADGENYTFTDGGTTYTVAPELVNGEYKQYYVTYGGEKCLARVTKALQARNTNSIYYVKKFSYQDGDPMLSSPVFVRWGEVILNRAEAYAKLGQDDKALADVNVLRTRAGIPAEGMFAADKMHGYATALDVVLDERRLELAFEGHRMFDVYRNKRDMDRRFPGAQPWEVVKYTDNKIQYPIPESEYLSSGIPQNPGY